MNLTPDNNHQIDWPRPEIWTCRYHCEFMENHKARARKYYYDTLCCTKLLYIHFLKHLIKFYENQKKWQYIMHCQVSTHKASLRTNPQWKEWLCAWHKLMIPCTLIDNVLKMQYFIIWYLYYLLIKLTHRSNNWHFDTETTYSFGCN